MSQPRDVGDADVGDAAQGPHAAPPQHEVEKATAAVAAVAEATRLCLTHGLRCAEPDLREAMASITANDSDAYAANAALLAARHARKMCPFRLPEVRAALGDAETLADPHDGT